MSDKTPMERIRAYEAKLMSVAAHVAALKIVANDFEQFSIHDKDLRRVRRAIIGIGDALEELLAGDSH